jgi:hypothetical protein
MKKLLTITITILAFIFFLSTINLDAAGGKSSFSSGSSKSFSSSSSGASKSYSSGGSNSTSGWSSKSSNSTPTPSVAPKSSTGGWTSSSSQKEATTKPSSESRWTTSSGESASATKESTSKTSVFGSSGSAVSKYEPKYTPPTDYRPKYYYGSPGYQGSSSGPIIINSGPGPVASMFDIWWKFQLLDTLTDRRERDNVIKELRNNPEYEKWKEEAGNLSKENVELKEKLQQFENENQNIKEEDSFSYMGWFFSIIGIMSLIIIGFVFVKIIL